MQILTLGHPDLQKVAAEVTDFSSDEILSDINTLKTAMKKHGGMGIAGPQLGIDRRILLIHSKPNTRYPDAPHSDLMVLINPQFQENIDQEEGWEGCLSVPGLRGLVSRSTEVSVKYQDEEGEWYEKRFEGFLARIFLHENDHLDGMTFVNRVADNSKLISEMEYFRQFS